MYNAVVTVRDNNNSAFEQIVIVPLNDSIVQALNSVYDYESFDEAAEKRYDKAYAELCRRIDNCGQGLPTDWYIDHYKIINNMELKKLCM